MLGFDQPTVKTSNIINLPRKILHIVQTSEKTFAVKLNEQEHVAQEMIQCNKDGDGFSSNTI